MIGFLIGAAVAAVAVKAARRAHRYHGCGGGWEGGDDWNHYRGRHGHHGFGGWRGGGFGGRRHGGFRGFGPKAMLRGLFERLETTPGQEKVILEAVDRVRTSGQGLRGELKSARADASAAMRAEHFDGARLKEAFARQDALLGQLRETMLAELSRIHEALDERQRRELADIVDGSGGFGPFGGGMGFGGHGHHHGPHGEGPFGGGRGYI